MSVDALTLTAVRNREDVWGKTRTNVFDVALSAGYPTGGYTFTPARVGLKTLQGVVMVGGNTIALLAFFNTSTGKLQIMSNPTGLEIADNVVLTGDTVRIRVEGE